MTEGGSADRPAYLVAAIALVGALDALTFHGTLWSSDEAYTHAVARALAERGVVSIDEMAWLQERVTGGRVGPDRHLYPNFGLGQSLAALPGYLVGRPLSPVGAVANFAGAPMGDEGAARGVLLTGLFASLASRVGAAQLGRVAVVAPAAR